MFVIDPESRAGQIAESVAGCLTKFVSNKPMMSGYGFDYRAQPFARLEDLVNWQCSVREIDEQITRIARRTTQHEYFIEAFLQKAERDAPREADIQEVRHLLQQCRNYFFTTPPSIPERFMRVDRMTIIDDPLFESNHVTRGSVVFVFRGFREC